MWEEVEKDKLVKETKGGACGHRGTSGEYGADSSKRLKGNSKGRTKFIFSIQGLIYSKYP